MSFMVAMENLTDVSHFSFAHHGITPSTLPQFLECLYQVWVIVLDFLDVIPEK